MKKIAIYINSLSRGGAERVTVYLSKYLSDHSYDVTIITSVRYGYEYYIPSNVNRISLEIPTRKHFIHIKKLRSIITDIKPDVILVMGVSMCATIIPACRGIDTKIVVSERNSPAHFSGKKITKILADHYIKKADGFIFQTEDAKKYYDKMLNGNGVVIPNPLISDNLPAPFEGKRNKEIVSVGRLDKQKNHKLLIEAFSCISDSFPEYKLIIYGEGILRTQLTSQIKLLGLQEKILLPGNCPNVIDKIKESSLFVMTSDFEGMPNALIEAMAVGLPCICTDCPCGGPRSLISDEYNGLLVPVGNKEKIAEAMSKLITSPDYASELGKNAVKIRETLDANIICEKWVKYIIL